MKERKVNDVLHESVGEGQNGVGDVLQLSLEFNPVASQSLPARAGSLPILRHICFYFIKREIYINSKRARCCINQEHVSRHAPFFSFVDSDA